MSYIYTKKTVAIHLGSIGMFMHTRIEKMIRPRHPNTCWEGIWTPNMCLKHRTSGGIVRPAGPAPRGYNLTPLRVHHRSNWLCVLAYPTSRGGCWLRYLDAIGTLENLWWNPWKIIFKSRKVNEWWLSYIIFHLANVYIYIYIIYIYICVWGPQQQHQEYITSSKKGITCHCCWKLSFMDSQPIWYEWFRTKRAPWFPFHFLRIFPKESRYTKAGHGEDGNMDGKHASWKKLISQGQMLLYKNPKDESTTS